MEEVLKALAFAMIDLTHRLEELRLEVLNDRTVQELQQRRRERRITRSQMETELESWETE